MKKSLNSLFIIPALVLAAACTKASGPYSPGGRQTYSYVVGSDPLDESWLDGGFTRASVLDRTFDEATAVLNDMDIFIYRDGILESYVYADTPSDIRISYEDASASYDIYVFGNVHGKLMSRCSGASGDTDAARAGTVFASEGTMKELSLPVCDNYSEFFINGFPQAKAYRNWIPRHHVGEPLRTSRLVSAFVLTTTRTITEANFYNGPTHIIPFKEQLTDADRRSGFGVERTSPVRISEQDLRDLNDPGKGLTFFFLENLQGANVFPAGTTSRTKDLNYIQDRSLRYEYESRLSYIELREEGEDEPVRIFLGNNAGNKFYENCDVRRNTVLYMSYKGADVPLNPGLYIKCNSRYSDMRSFFGEQDVCFDELVPGYGTGNTRFGSNGDISVDNFELCAVGEEYRRVLNGRNYDVTVHGASTAAIRGYGEKHVMREQSQDMLFPHIGRQDFDGYRFSGSYSVNAYPYFGIAVNVAGDFEEARGGALSRPVSAYWAELNGGLMSGGDRYIHLRPAEGDFDCYFINLLGEDVVTEISVPDPDMPPVSRLDGLYFRNGLTTEAIKAPGTFSSEYGISTEGYDGEVLFYEHIVTAEYDSNGSCYPSTKIDSEGYFEYYADGVKQPVSTTLSQPVILRSSLQRINRTNSQYPYSDGAVSVGSITAFVTVTVNCPGGSRRIWGYITETDDFGGMFRYYHGAYTD